MRKIREGDHIILCNWLNLNPTEIMNTSSSLKYAQRKKFRDINVKVHYEPSTESLLAIWNIGTSLVSDYLMSKLQEKSKQDKGKPNITVYF